MSLVNQKLKKNYEELPLELRESLVAFLETRSDVDLGRLVRAALSDFSEGELPSELSDSANFMQDLGLDSLAITEFVFFFEDIFELKITNEDLAKLRTVGDMKEFLKARLAA